jgi:hypothetical protein
MRIVFVRGRLLGVAADHKADAGQVVEFDLLHVERAGVLRLRAR